ncbi:hypothetical protein [Sphingopyxis chilensis]|uniref:hypothetical protein n=1 Tax=Sphingopyxis chilensis TaxID=180400 RepID=UPI002DDCBF2A|nr:hypothetical protein [Sphingopyxis chilensis]
MRIASALGMLALATILVSVTPVPACADSWVLPTTATYSSCAGHARITITPRDIESQLAYFGDKVKEVETAGQNEGGASVATAQLERLVNKRWQIVWAHQILNDVAPVSAIVRDDGEYAITFDDWHGTGYGPNAVVIYGSRGKLVRALALSDILPADYIEALPHSVSSIHWRGDPHFSPNGQKVVIPVVIPSEDFVSDPATIDIAVDLTDGTVSPINRGTWDAALAAARTVLAARTAHDAAAKAAFLAPLLGPKTNSEREWHDYLREAVGRLIGDEHTPSTTVLRLPSADNYAVSETWVRDALTESYADKVALASLSEANLVNVLKKIAAKLPDRSLSEVTVFIAMSDQNWSVAKIAMKRSGAKIVQLDPDEAIPQRPERITRRYPKD